MPQHLGGHTGSEEAAQHPVLAGGSVNIKAASHHPAEAAGGRGLERADKEERGAGHGVGAEVNGGGDGEPEEGDSCECQELVACSSRLPTAEGALHPRERGGGAQEAGDACVCVVVLGWVDGLVGLVVG